jgi:hypothetical protein
MAVFIPLIKLIEMHVQTVHPFGGNVKGAPTERNRAAFNPFAPGDPGE